MVRTDIGMGSFGRAVYKYIRSMNPGTGYKVMSPVCCMAIHKKIQLAIVIE